MGVIPIVNENDTLAVSEIKFGDNDTLSAITAAMVHADLLFLMTDVDCLYDKNPRTNPDAQPIEVVEDIGALVADGKWPLFAAPSRCLRTSFLTCASYFPVSQAGSSLGTGGMSTKIVAARLATSAGVTTVITRSSNPGNIHKIVKHIQGSHSPASLTTQVNHPSTAALASLNNGSGSGTSTPAAAAATPSIEQAPAVIDRSQIPLHTRFLPSPSPVRDRYFWILHGLRPHGTLYIDQGAYKALLGKAGLLPVGVVDVEGFFAQQEAVRLCVVDKRRSTPGPDGKMWEGEAVEVGRCLTNYASAEIARIKGHQSVEIGQLLGYADSEYVAQRESVSFYNTVSRPASPVGGHRA